MIYKDSTCYAQISDGKWLYVNQYYLRMQCEKFLIVVDKYTGEYRNIYSGDNKLAVEFLKEVASLMEKHKNLK